VRHADHPAFAGYALVDGIVGAFRAAYPNATLIVCSDHGWTYSGFGHYSSPDGILLVAGPGVRPETRLERAHIRDVAPTMLALLDIPLSEELAGAPLDALFERPPRVGRVAAYGPPTRREGESRAADEETLDQLEALGYVR